MAVTVRNVSKGTLLGQHIAMASTFWTRLKGLLGTTHLSPGQGLFITPCNSIHMFGMKYAIDVLFLDAAMRVIQVVPNLQPGQTASCRGSAHVLELPAGVARATNTKAHDTLQLA
jgi:uncharacterized membrane protein (UPF0127 family)